MSGLKNHSFRQGIYAQSSTAREKVGTIRITRDGRKFRYSKCGATGIAVGKMTLMADVAANVSNQAAAAAGAAAIGATQITFAAGGAVTYAADYFAGGMLVINDATGEGAQYEIAGSTAVAAGTSITLTLARALNVAIVSTSEWSLVHNPGMAVITSTDEENHPTGVTPIAVTAAYYFWAQVGGVATVLVNGTIAVWDMVVPGAVAGSVKVIPDWAAATDSDMPILGQAIRAGVDTEYTAVNLNIV